MLSIASSFTIFRDVGLNLFLPTILSYPGSYLVPIVMKLQTQYYLAVSKTY